GGGVEGEEVWVFLVRVGGGGGVRAGLQRVDHRLGEALADLHGRQVRAERLGLRTQLGQRGREVGAGQSDVGAGAPVVVGVVDAEAVRIVGHRGDGDARSAGLVQGDRQVVAVQQVDAVEAGIAGE